MSYLTEAPRIFFGTGMLSHQLIASIVPGTALCLLIFAIKSNTKKEINYFNFYRLFLSIFIVQFSIALISGLSLETGLSYFWPGLQESLAYLVHYPFGRSALIAFIIVGGISYFLLKINQPKQYKQRIIFCAILFLSSFFLSLWSMIINCMMQDPSSLTFEWIDNTKVITAVDFKSILSNEYFIYRLLHTYQSSLIQGVALILFVLVFIFYKNNYTLKKPKKLIFTFVIFLGILLITQPLLGHLQFGKLTKIQPTKAAALEGYFEEESGFQMYLFGKVDMKDSSTTGIKAPNFIKDKFIQNQSEIQPLNQVDSTLWPPIKRVFNGFHIMILSWIFMVMLLVTFFILTKKRVDFNRIHVNLVGLIFILTIVASLSGWVVSETGRQPWIFFGEVNIKDVYVKVESTVTFWTIIFGNVIFPIALFSLGTLIHKRLVLNFIKSENRERIV